MTKKGDRTTVEKIGDVLGDLVDLFGLGQRALSDLSDLVTKESGKTLIEETKVRGNEIRTSRKKDSQKGS